MRIWTSAFTTAVQMLFIWYCGSWKTFESKIADSINLEAALTYSSDYEALRIARCLTLVTVTGSLAALEV